MAIDELHDRAGDLMGPEGQPTLNHWAGFGEVAARCLHRLLDDRSHARPEIELAREHIDAYAERAECALHRRVTDKRRFVSPVPHGECRGHQRGQVAAGSAGRNDQDPRHASMMPLRPIS